MSSSSSDSSTSSGRSGQSNVTSETTFDASQELVVDSDDTGMSPSSESGGPSYVVFPPESTSTAADTLIERAPLPESALPSTISLSTRPIPLPRSFGSTVCTLSSNDVSLPEIRALSPDSRSSETFPFCESPCSLSRPSTSEGLRPAPLFHSRQAANVLLTSPQEDSPPSLDSTDRDLKAQADFQRFIDWQTTQWRSDLYALQALDAQQTYRSPNTYSQNYRLPAETDDNTPSLRPYFEWLPRTPSEFDPRDPFTITTNAAAEYQRQAFWEWKQAEWRGEDTSEHIEHRVRSQHNAVTADEIHIFKEDASSWPTRRASHTGEDVVDTEIKWQLIRNAFWDHRRQLLAEQERKVKGEEGYDRNKHWWPASTKGKVQEEEPCPTRARGRGEDEHVLTGGGREGVNVFHAVQRELQGMKDLAGPAEVQRKVFWAGKRQEWKKVEKGIRDNEGFVVVSEGASEEEQKMFREVRARGFRLWGKKPNGEEEQEECLVGKGKVRRRYAGGLFYKAR